MTTHSLPASHLPALLVPTPTSNYSLPRTIRYSLFTHTPRKFEKSTTRPVSFLMHNRHPNQVRSACERCRRQKLRCSRQTAPFSTSSLNSTASGSAEDPCARCSRLGVSCHPGLQRKVGRPTRRDHNRDATVVGSRPEPASSQGRTPPSGHLHHHLHHPITPPSSAATVDTATAPEDDGFTFTDADLDCNFSWTISEDTIDPGLGLLDLDIFRPFPPPRQSAVHLSAGTF